MTQAGGGGGGGGGLILSCRVIGGRWILRVDNINSASVVFVKEAS